MTTPLPPPIPLRAYMRFGTLLPRGRFVWWYCITGALVLVGGILFASLLQGAEHESNAATHHVNMLLVGIIFILAALLPPWLNTQRVYAQDFPAPKGLLGWRMGVVVAMMALIQIVMALFEALTPNARAASEQVARSLQLGLGFWPDVAIVLAVAVMAPLSEELLFRGLFYRSLRDGLARWMPLRFSGSMGVVLSSLLFTVMHVGDGQITQWPALFIMGVLLALTYEWTGSLLAPMLVHALNSTFALFAMLSLPDVRFSSHWIELLTACSPLLVLALGWLLRLLPQAPSSRLAHPLAHAVEPPPLP